MLRKYCDLHKIQIRKVIWEDHSAKDFDRPEWQKYLKELKPKKNRGLVDYLLFLKWDRFSRNISLGYQMIQTFRDYGVEA